MRLLPIYRVSTASQGGGVDREGLDRQRASAAQVALAQGAILLPAVEVIGVSGGDLDQTPEWASAIIPAIQQPDVHLVADSIERILRADKFNFSVFQALLASDTRIYTPSKTYDLSTQEDSLLAPILALLGGIEKREIRRRAVAGKEAIRRRGEWASALWILPTGITYSRETRVWSYDADAPKIKLMYELWVGGQSRRAIARSTGLAMSNIHGRISNPIYRGILSFRTKKGDPKPRKDGRQPTKRDVPRAPEEVIERRVFGGEGQADQLVSDALWYAAQKRLREGALHYGRRREEGREHVWACGYVYSHRALPPVDSDGTFGFSSEPDAKHKIQSHGGGARPRYACSCRPRSDRCDLPMIPAPVLNETLDVYLTSLTTEDWFVESVRKQTKPESRVDPKEERAKLLREQDALEKKRVRITEMYIEGDLSREQRDKRIANIKQRVAEIDLQLTQIEDVPPAPTDFDLKRLTQSWGWDSSWGYEEKRSWLARYDARITISRSGIETCTLRIPAEGMPLFGCGRELGWVGGWQGRGRRS